MKGLLVVLLYVTTILARSKDVATSASDHQQLRSEVDSGPVLPGHCKFVDFNKDKGWLDFYVPKLSYVITRQGRFRNILMKDFSPLVVKNGDSPGAPIHVDRRRASIPAIGKYELVLSYNELRAYNFKSYHGRGFKAVPGKSNEVLVNVKFNDLLIESDIYVQYGKKTNGFLTQIICFFYKFDFCATKLRGFNIKAELRMPHVEGRGRLRLDVVDSTKTLHHRAQALWDTTATFLRKGPAGISDQIMSNIYDAEMLEVKLLYNTIIPSVKVVDDPFADFEDSEERRSVIQFVTKSAHFASSHFLPKQTRTGLENLILFAINGGIEHNRPKFWKQYQFDHKRPLRL